MPKVHMRVEYLQVSFGGVVALYYTACGRLLKNKPHGRTIADVTCLSCKRTSYAARWRHYHKEPPCSPSTTQV